MTLSEAVKAGMQQTNELFGSSVVRNRQIDALDNIYTTDATILPPGADLIHGRTQIKAFWKQAIETLGATDAKLTTVQAESIGDTVVEIGRADLTLHGEQVVAVKYVVHWKQEDGRWKWHIDVWNLNQ
jgi:ketosteroid isomerase-like protein